MMNTNETIKYKILSTIRYLGDGFFYPFFALYLRYRNLTESKIGFLLSISPLLAILLNPLYSALCRRAKDTKNVLMVITILEGIIIAAISFTKNYYVITALTLLIAIFGCCHYGLMDALTALYAKKAEINYSSIRVFGSFAYIIATTLSGFICSKSFQISFIVTGILFILSGFFYHILLDIEEEDKLEKKSSFKEIETLAKNKSFVYFIIVYMLILGIAKVTDNFFPVYLETRGIGSKEYGLIYSYFVFFEVLALIVLNRIKKGKMNTYFLLIISCICLLLRTLPNYFNLNVNLIIALSALRGIGYAIVLHISFSYVIKLVKEDLAAHAIMIITLFYSIFVFIFNNISGNLIEKYSYDLFYLVCIILILILLALILIKYIKDRIKNVRI